MADEILSIDTDTLDGIADAIRSKGGLPQSNKLSFPNGMVSALQNIETVATTTPKVSPVSVKELTPSETAFPLAAGYHTNDTTVIISATTGSATPSSTEQTYYPPSPYNFFSSFWVNGVGNGYQVASGTIDANSQDITISGLPFTPSGIAGILLDGNSISGDKTAAFQSISPASTSIYSNLIIYSKKFWNGRVASSKDDFYSFSYGTANVNFIAVGSSFRGKYYYIVWGN